ncbi:MAG: aminopeptidase P family protein [Rhodospirillaceae bacterium]|jgi:Xaa-Pro aminopeptidase|nr:aminopeptidase P family protein [Rhodospirillaceae bacterium]MBT7451675.1 aminopeptidase P family protein [Rhodospirillaceae bacterium]
MINRRTVLGTLAAGGAGALVAPSVSFAAPAMTVTPSVPPPVLGPRMNFEQADKIMAELGLDAIVVGAGTNLYHATGLDLTATKMGHTPGVYAVITRREEQRLSLIAPAFLYYYTIAMDHRHLDYPAYLYRGPAQMVDDSELGMDDLPLYPDLQKAPLDLIETTRLSIIERAVQAEAARPNLKFALANALKDTGVAKGRIAADVEPVMRSVIDAAEEATVVSADDALRRIRPVKSDAEITLMRYAAQANADGALEAASAVRAGADVRELRTAYFTAVASRGMRGVFLVIDRVSSPTYEAQLHDGQCFSIDCVSEYMGYHGDFARAVHIGETSKAMRRVSELTGKSWDHIRERIKPGLTFSEVQRMGKEALRKMGADFSISFTPHSVGLYHADHVGSAGSPPREDIVLEKNMVLSIDCPMGATGMGGSSHLEDLMLITDDGAEPINDTGSQTIMV